MESPSTSEKKPFGKGLALGATAACACLGAGLWACEPGEAFSSRLAARFGTPPGDAALGTEGEAQGALKPSAAPDRRGAPSSPTLANALAEGEPSERASGPNQTRAGADALDVAGGARSGTVSFKDGNRSDWYRLVLPDPGVYRLEFHTEPDALGLDAEIFEEGSPRPLKSTEILDLLRPRDLYVRVAAPEPLARGTYRLSVGPAARAALDEVKGQVLRFNGTQVTLDLGAEDGMKVGLQGIIHRSDATAVEFVVKRVLKRSSSVEVRSALSEADLGAKARVTGTQASLTPDVNETRVRRE